MARITVEDCLDNVNNRFELVLLAADRARDLVMKGIEPNVPWDNHKATVVALREIAAGFDVSKGAKVKQKNEEVTNNDIRKDASNSGAEIMAEVDLVLNDNPEIDSQQVEIVKDQKDTDNS